MTPGHRMGSVAAKADDRHMTFSGIDLPLVTALTGSLPALVAIAVAVVWWLDDELDTLPD
jgi:hypothetical protein